MVRCKARDAAFDRRRRAGIGANLHYIPVHLHPYHRKKWETGPGLCPVAEAAYEQIVSLPVFPGLLAQDVARIVDVLADSHHACRIAA